MVEWLGQLGVDDVPTKILAFLSFLVVTWFEDGIFLLKRRTDKKFPGLLFEWLTQLDTRLNEDKVQD